MSGEGGAHFTHAEDPYIIVRTHGSFAQQKAQPYPETEITLLVIP